MVIAGLAISRCINLTRASSDFCTVNPTHTFVAFFSSSPTPHSKRRMPPKKAAAVEKPKLGRPSNNLKMGIVGLPNVGKSSLFNVIAKCDLGKSANFPYATIEPEEARVPVPDERYLWLVDQYKPKSEVPAFLTCIDIAGLTAGASTGAGLGNAFLSNVRAVDGIFQVVRAFDDAEVIHVEGDVDPCRDMKIISTELRLKDIEWVEKALEAGRKAFKGTGGPNTLEGKKKLEEIATMEKALKALTEDNTDIRKVDWGSKEVDTINNLSLLTAKPVIYLVNLSERDYVRKKNKWLPKIKQWIDENNPGDQLIPFSVALEERLLQLGSPEAEAEELKSLGDNITGALGKITKAGYVALDLISFLTAGADEVRAWTIRKGLKAPEAGTVIHTDFAKRFVCVEVINFETRKEFASEAECKANGKIRQEGKQYVVTDGDILHFQVGR